MSSLRLSLQRDLFQHSDEKLLYLINVNKAHKKKLKKDKNEKKMYFLALVANDVKKCYVIYLIKKVDRNFKKHSSWMFNDLRLVDGKSDTNETNEFELHFVGKQVYKWMANTINEKYNFIQILSMYSNHQMSFSQVQFIRIPKDILVESVEANQLFGNAIDNIPADNFDEEEAYQALTSREEADLEKLMEQCEFTIHNAEAFTEQLSKEVTATDATNIQNIMLSEQRVINLMRVLQNAVDETSKLEQKISHYETLLKSVKDVVIQVEQKEALVQKQSENNSKLMNELENLIIQLDFSKENEQYLIEGDLTGSRGISMCNKAAKCLEDALNANIHPALLNMIAVQDQRRILDKIKIKFSSRLSHHLNNLFSHLINQYGEELMSKISSEGELKLPVHSLIHDVLKPYSYLMKWLRTNDKETYSSLVKTYKFYISKQYENEIRIFFELTKERLATNRNTNNLTGAQGFDNKRRSIPGPDGTYRKGSSSIASAAMNPDQFETTSRTSEISLSEWEEFDATIERVLNSIDPVCVAEQNFCEVFFNIEIITNQNDSQPLSSFSSSPSRSSNFSQNSSETPESKKNEKIRLMMNDIFSNLESEFISFATIYDRIDGLYSMYLLVRMTHHVLSAQDTSSFLSKTYGNILIQIKRSFDRFMLSQQNAIEEAKAPKRPKCGVLPFIKRFEIFAKQAENIFRNPLQRRSDVDRWYTQLVRCMFDTINRIAEEHHKTPSEMVRLENYHYLYNSLSTLKIACLDGERKEAKNRYNEAVKDYVARYFGRPLEKLNVFFDGVQQKVAQGVKEEEIGYQLAFSKQELRKVINSCTLKEVKKGLEEMYKRVEKHTCEPDTNLIQVSN